MEGSSITQSSHIRKLISHKFMGYKPTYKDTCEEAYHRQEQLACNKVEQIENSPIEEQRFAPWTQRQRADDSHEDTTKGNQ